MSCNETKKGPKSSSVEFDADCKCQSAVLRAYKSLLSVGTPECRALEAAQIVYSHHHPEDSRETAALIVERWVNAGHFH